MTLEMAPNPASRIRDLRTRLGLNQKSFGKLVGVDQTTVSRWESGVHDPESQALLQLARLAQTSVEEFVQQDISRSVVINDLHVIGMVQAGEWVDAVEWEPEDRYAIAVPQHPIYSKFKHYGLEVRGPSMDEVYPQGTILDCVLFGDLGRTPVDEERVIVERRRADGLIEATVKEFRLEEDGSAWLWPRSRHPQFQTPWRIGKVGQDGDSEAESVRITGLVTGSYKFEPSR